MHTPSVFAANITRATITKDYLPKALASARTVSLPSDSKIIDYALVLRPDKDEIVTDERMGPFLDLLDHLSFNQSNSSELQGTPSGVFIETKSAFGKENEAKTQLGIWLASWFDRVTKFPCDSDPNNDIDPNDVLPPPVIPLIIIEGRMWELWFAFSLDSSYCVYGPIELGNTYLLLGLYQILAVLRVLVEWMATDFRDWVDQCLKNAGV
ncbi:hypothetical protein F4860DRAFT_529758 [Xylaria cubensis]|nr:hypothetical protein F4860DRAFT_529758 [Xylaria cubensis]